MRADDVSLHRDFETGRLYCAYRKQILGSMSDFCKVIHEPISQQDIELIGDTPIPPKREKVDL